MGFGRTVLAHVKRAMSATVLLAYALTAPASADIRNRIHETQQHMHDTHVQLQQKQVQLRTAQAREEDLRRQLAETDNDIRGVNQRLGIVESEIASNRRKLAFNELQLHAAQETLERHNAALRRRLIDSYENGNLAYLEVLLSAHSFSEFAGRWDDIAYLVAANERTIRERRAAEHVVAAVQADLESTSTILDEQQTHENEVHEQLGALDERRRNLVAVTDQIRRQASTEVVQLEESSQAEEDQLQSLIVERQREEAAALAAAREAARRAAQLSGQALPPETSAPGDFSWPVSGPITSPFGMRLDPVSGKFTRMHTGIDIGAPMGATIAAASAGRIIVAAMTDGGYGNMVVIDHGGGISTVYAHCSQIFVAQGQDVQRGQAIAAVGSTGHSTGPHLHFEVRVNGQPVDPTSRLH